MEKFRAATNITGTAQEKEERMGLAWLKKYLVGPSRSRRPGTTTRSPI